ncbi:MAG: hypothetical protein PHO10_00150 [Gemmiger sp.]|nr:hypothetical protein [Gemmiger sp.]
MSAGQEKRRIALLCLVACGALFFQLAILPAWGRYTAARQALDAATAQQAATESLLAATQPTAETAQNSQASQASQAGGSGSAGGTPGCLPSLRPAALDSLVTGLLLDAGITPLSLSLAEPQPLAQTSESAAPGYAQTTALRCRAQCSRDAFWAFLTALQTSQPALRVTDFSFTDTAYRSGTAGIQTETQVEFGLLFYGCTPTPGG